MFLEIVHVANVKMFQYFLFLQYILIPSIILLECIKLGWQPQEARKRHGRSYAMLNQCARPQLEEVNTAYFYDNNIYIINNRFT
jgi:hypothetical protein